MSWHALRNCVASDRHQSARTGESRPMDLQDDRNPQVAARRGHGLETTRIPQREESTLSVPSFPSRGEKECFQPLSSLKESPLSERGFTRGRRAAWFCRTRGQGSGRYEAWVSTSLRSRSRKSASDRGTNAHQVPPSHRVVGTGSTRYCQILWMRAGERRAHPDGLVSLRDLLLS